MRGRMESVTLQSRAIEGKYAGLSRARRLSENRLLLTSVFYCFLRQQHGIVCIHGSTAQG
jgi:hypothetical protein